MMKLYLSILLLFYLMNAKYNFVTPVTSMTVVKPGNKEDVDEGAADESAHDCPPPAPTVPVYKPFFFGDPHFMVKLKNVTFPICYEIPTKAELMTLIYDPVLQINVTAKMIEGRGSYKAGHPNITYIGKIYIRTADVEIMIATHEIVFDGKRLIWKRVTDIAFSGASCEVNGKGIFVQIKISPGLTFLIRRNLYNYMGPKYGYLTFFLLNDKGFSPKVSGVIGRFIPMKGHLMKQHKISEDKTEAMLKLTEPRKHYKRSVHTFLQIMPGLMSAVIPCWKIDIDKLCF
ncbi:inter-alpha-trypsin inhibitor heavy chain H3 isoform X2 [Octopus bimaculoides]|uniref:Inter-alpha-trypsin inhibitor heavy chain C-terminal domain-containing protein n=1 Tax=Octopus bimaculoides TaxID=37653 RepID=A0A0L8FMG0_OCTBM|nr:inter-alpha-trypsin inhibitor heavy chain H3 isoform X2 [Octopus bimaculoides]|eukprot:XP_014788733.1 PREDICTED: inter-alpha-trypsin inhibitor heavy chain H3-like isoform X2 [Octopus bimaculoides]